MSRTSALQNSKFTPEQREVLQEDGRGEDGTMRDIVMHYVNNFGIYSLNIILLVIVYPVMFAAGVVGILFPCIWPNTPGIVIVTISIVAVFSILHFGLKILQCCCKNVIAYPREPVWLYMVGDAILFTAVLGMVTGIISDLGYQLEPSPFLPMIASWIVSLVAMLNFDLVRRVMDRGPANLGDIKLVPKRDWCRDCCNMFLYNTRDPVQE